jgi:mRNA interferase MazF
MPPFDDLLVCGISTQVHRELKGFDEVISEETPDFRSSGLKASSLIRLGFLAVVPAAQIRGAIGRISDERLDQLRQRLSAFLLACD